MTNKPHPKPRDAAPKSAIIGQILACTVAVAIMALGLWTLLGQNAPYHPDGVNDDVTRSDAPAFGTFTD